MRDGIPMIDGYRVHTNPDGSSIFIEGRELKGGFLLGDGASDAIDACAKRRGLCDGLFLQHNFSDPAVRWRILHFAKLRRIIYMERKFCGEEGW